MRVRIPISALALACSGATPHPTDRISRLGQGDLRCTVVANRSAGPRQYGCKRGQRFKALSALSKLGSDARESRCARIFMQPVVSNITRAIVNSHFSEILNPPISHIHCHIRDLSHFLIAQIAAVLVNSTGEAAVQGQYLTLSIEGLLSARFLAHVVIQTIDWHGTERALPHGSRTPQRGQVLVCMSH